MLLINREINLIWTWSKDNILISGVIDYQVPKFAITDSKLYVPVAILSTQENVKLLDQLKSGLKETITWDQYPSKVSKQARNPYLKYLIEASFQGVNRLLVLSFENNAHQTCYKRYFLPTETMKDYNVLIDGKNLFDLPVKNDQKTYDNIIKNATYQGDEYAIDYLLHYMYFQSYYKTIAIHLSQQKALVADPKTIQQINLTGNPDRAGNTTTFSNIEEGKETF